MYPTRCAAPSVVATHLSLESGATEGPVSQTKQVPTTGGACVHMCVLWYYLNNVLLKHLAPHGTIT